MWTTLSVLTFAAQSTKQCGRWWAARGIRPLRTRLLPRARGHTTYSESPYDRCTVSRRSVVIRGPFAQPAFGHATTEHGTGCAGSAGLLHSGKSLLSHCPDVCRLASQSGISVAILP